MIRSPIRRNTYICDLCNGLISSIISEKGGKKENEEEEEGEKDKGSVYLPKELRHSAREDAKGFTPKLRNMKPSDICRKLDQYIIGQKRAKIALSVAVSNHVKRLQDMSGLIKKSNILLVGSSGTGKTLLTKTLADILNVPFAVLDSTKISPTGYMGNDAEVCLQQLLAKAKGNVQIAQRGVVFIDEIDKLAGLDETINLTEPDDSITKEYQMLFKKDGIDLLFDDDALHEIARLAFENGTGARGLRTILEDVLMDIMYELPNMENITECRITKDTITTKIPVWQSVQDSELYLNDV